MISDILTFVWILMSLPINIGDYTFNFSSVFLVSCFALIASIVIGGLFFRR